ncbi:MAG: histidinol dehydrogenase [Pseudomonadota bacterium]|nr:histidinol dehydrogenase [Pseudomonadota bacterium]
MATLGLRQLNTCDAEFDAELVDLLSRSRVADERVEAAVSEIIARVREAGDTALIELATSLDKFTCEKPGDLEVPRTEIESASANLDQSVRRALGLAAERVRSFHQRQLEQSWQYDDGDGNCLGQRVTPIERVGIYVPGGKAAYPSSVLMNAIPASVAGVGEVIMAVPAPGGEVSSVVLAAAELAGVSRVFRIGGAQAIAALAFGTQTVPKVDKIVGPGNAYVAAAKKQVYGQVGIDMIAGPSEVVIVCDDDANPDWVAMDLFAQAEHDEMAQAILVCPTQVQIDRVQASMRTLIGTLARADIIDQSIAAHGATILVQSLAEAINVVNRIAPEHLQLMVESPEALLPTIRHAGAIFCGYFSAEVLGDYCAGPSHVLPTTGTARFSSPLGVYDFQKRSSLIMCSKKGAQHLAGIASILARSEGLDAHAGSADRRSR